MQSKDQSDQVAFTEVKVMTPICSKADLDAVLLQPQAFLFLWVNWSGPARTSQATVEDAILSWQAEHPDRSVPSFIANVSDQCGELWDALLKWLTSEGVDARFMVSGTGPLLWLRSGKIVLHVAGALQHKAAKLVAVTNSVFLSET